MVNKNLYEVLKQLSVSSNQATNPCNWLLGTVETINPLSIRISAEIVLPQSFLTLSNNVKDHYEDITVSFQTEEDNFMKPDHTHPYTDTPVGASTTQSTIDLDTTHKHEIKHKIKILKHLGLKIGEKVVLLQMSGGKQFYVLDRLSEPITEGEFL